MANLEEFDLGDSPTITAAFTVADVATDPTTVALTVTDPNGTPTTYTYALTQVTRTGVGTYQKQLTVGTAGEWSVVWTGTGAVVASGTKRFSVRRAGA